MTTKPSERLKEIEKHTQGTIPTDIWDDHQWLIARVKRLTEALEKIADPRKRDHTEPDKYTEVGCMMNIAEETLSGS